MSRGAAELGRGDPGITQHPALTVGPVGPRGVGEVDTVQLAGLGSFIRPVSTKAFSTSSSLQAKADRPSCPSQSHVFLLEFTLLYGNC